MNIIGSILFHKSYALIMFFFFLSKACHNENKYALCRWNNIYATEWGLVVTTSSISNYSSLSLS